MATSDLRGAGTSGNVYITLFGTEGNSGARPLENGPNNFSRGQTDVFEVLASVGELESIRIGHDNSGVSPSWHLKASMPLSAELQGTAACASSPVYSCVLLCPQLCLFPLTGGHMLCKPRYPLRRQQVATESLLPLTDLPLLPVPGCLLLLRVESDGCKLPLACM